MTYAHNLDIRSPRTHSFGNQDRTINKDSSCGSGFSIGKDPQKLSDPCPIEAVELLLCDYELDSAIRQTTGIGLVAGDRFVLTGADNGHAIALDTLLN